MYTLFFVCCVFVRRDCVVSIQYGTRRTSFLTRFQYRKEGHKIKQTGTHAKNRIHEYYLRRLRSSGDDDVIIFHLQNHLQFSMPHGAPALPSATRRTRPRDCTKSTLHNSPRCPRRKKGHRRPTRRARGESRFPPGDGLLGPRIAGDKKKCKSQQEFTATNRVRRYSPTDDVLTAVLLYMVGGLCGLKVQVVW